ncbi:Spy/CpxP family protein refolding chaperone [Aquincola tertiaricarbonis]|uniref:Spy/CpxP family protein refolding chaperone n=1 Tax=Aquincola tertiaricarbonis TaxID=391953 RepID=A0ABY4S616_AQUTE|nr:Spy/CpxP family protein refolding chaperone [Aquincola tertiaricarbonis]URI08140.1 Spy/CpxP family protein refolding chaperone [Aquincola tertiaricarbonis]
MKTRASIAHPFRWMAASLLLAGASVAMLPTASRADTPPPPAAGHPMPPGSGFVGMPLQGPGMQRMLDDVKATPEQRDQIRQITEAAAADLRSQQEASRSLHDEAGKIFTAPIVDADAAERLRQQMMAQHEQASRRMMQVMVDVAKVLTPEQRQQLAERMARGPEERRGPMHRGAPRGERAPAG